jgi:hypothetical protein
MFQRLRYMPMALMVYLVLCSLLCHAQMTTRDLTGIVTDAHHEPLKGAVVQVQNGVTSTVVSYITGVDGHYSFKRLDGETDYRFWATYRGQQSKVEKLSHFDSDKPKVANLIVQPKY